MASLYSLLPDSHLVVNLEPEELAGYLLEYIHSLPETERQHLNRSNLFVDPRENFREYPTEYQEAVGYAFLEAWTWLENQGLIIRRFGDSAGNAVKLSRRGQGTPSRAALDVYRAQGVLSRARLGSRIRGGSWGLFVRGEYEQAVFNAFKQVEVYVREAAGLKDTDIGVDLIRKAFRDPDGPLCDTRLSSAERQAMANLFAGSIGLFKNPLSHRRVVLSDPAEAAEMIMFANYLVRVVERFPGTVSGDRQPNASVDANPSSV